jgi:hypothetical protein
LLVRNEIVLSTLDTKVWIFRYDQVILLISRINTGLDASTQKVFAVEKDSNSEVNGALGIISANAYAATSVNLRAHYLREGNLSRIIKDCVYPELGKLTYICVV